MSRCVVLLSGGLDSMVSLATAAAKTDIIKAITFDYGQQASKREIEASSNIAKWYNVSHQVIKLPWLQDIDTSSLQSGGTLPDVAEADLDNPGVTENSAKSVWVPNRNGLFINIAACFAESVEAGLVVTGFNREEAATFADNSVQFIEAANDCLAYSTRAKVKVWAPTQVMDKRAIAMEGKRLKIPWQYLWSCYGGADRMCGCCESCRRLLRALKGADVDADILGG